MGSNGSKPPEADQAVEARHDSWTLLNLSVKTLAGDLLAIEIASNALVIDLKRRLFSINPLFAVGKQRLTVMRTSDADDEQPPWTLLANLRTLASFGITSDCELNLVVDEGCPPFTDVSGYLPCLSDRVATHCRCFPAE